MCQSPSHSGILIVCIANIGILGISAMNLNLWLMLMDNNSTFSTTAKLKGKKIKKNNLQCRIYILKRHICLKHTLQSNLYLLSFVKTLHHTILLVQHQKEINIFFFLKHICCICFKAI
jgi:hypothetical protein